MPNVPDAGTVPLRLPPSDPSVIESATLAPRIKALPSLPTKFTVITKLKKVVMAGTDADDVIEAIVFVITIPVILAEVIVGVNVEVPVIENVPDDKIFRLEIVEVPAVVVPVTTLTWLPESVNGLYK